jgi:hypothetical protein
MREFLNILAENRAQPFPGLTPEFLAKLREIRHQCRIDNGGGGSCHLVSEWLDDEYGWDRVSGTYTSADYQDVAITGHLWNLLPDNSILDATADQTGEGHDIRVIHPSDPEYHRYRPEWYPDFHPDHEDFEKFWAEYQPLSFPHYDGSKYPKFSGEDDYTGQNRLRDERGDYWWSTDKEQLARYHDEQQREYDWKRGQF